MLVRKHFRRLSALICIGIVSVSTLAQDAASPGTSGTVDFFEGRIEEVEASSALDDTNKNALLDLYRKSLSQIRQRQTYEEGARRFVELRETAPKQAAEVRSQIEKLEAQPPPKLPAALGEQSLAQLEQVLLGEKAEMANLRASLTEYGALLQTQSQRSPQVRERLDQARQRQAEISTALNIPPTPGQSQRLAEARLWQLQVESRTLVAEIEMLNQELLSQPMRIELLNAQRDLASLRWDRQKKYVDLIGALAGERRVGDAQSTVEEVAEVERGTFGKHPLVQELAQANTKLSTDISGLAALVDEINSDENKVTEQVKRFATSFRLTRQKLEIAGLSQALGEALLKQRNSLPRAREFKSAEERLERLLVESSLRQIQHQQERAQISDLDEYVAQLTEKLTSSWQSWLGDELRALALQRRELLDKAIAADDSLLQALSELEFAQRELSKVVNDFNRLLDERLLWVRTGETPTWQTLASIGPALSLLFSLDDWGNVARAILMPDFFPWALLTGVLLFALLLQRTPAMRASLHRCGRNVGQLRHDRLYYSLKALVLTLVLALPWPVLFVALGLHLQMAPGMEQFGINKLYQYPDWGGQFVPSIGRAFSEIAMYTFLFLAFRVFCEKGGLAVAHFRWSLFSTEILRREMLYLMVVFLPSVFVLNAIVYFDPGALAGGLSRLLVFVIIATLAVCFGRILSPGKGALRDFYQANPESPLTWLRYLWFAIALALPLLLVALSTAGYVYTSTQLGERLIDSLWLIAAIILIHQLVVRWVTLIERQLQFRDTLERHRAQRAARETQEEDAVQTDAIEEPEIDISALSDNTQKLINTAVIVFSGLGMWFIWSDVLPAFRILDEVSLWTYNSTVEGVTKVVPVTLGNVTTVLLITVFGAIAAMRLPALLEILLFARFNITAGSRYAISKLTQYCIIAIGVVWASSVLGGSWSEIQWLVAALGVGIGFGLQEIIANFISGLILLFERPIRIGDIVTVGDTSGVVTRIRIRSTTIRNWDQQELLVPNKEFITGRLLNWTLTDPIARIVINVGVAYGSDVEKALKILVECAERHERVLDEPPPLVTFDGFGDNSLQLVMRCYIGSMDYRLVTKSELNQEINREMAAAGIVIAFPQRDVHLDTSQPLDVHLHRAPREIPES